MEAGMAKYCGIAVVNQNEIEGEGLRQILVDRLFDVVGVYKSYLELPTADETGDRLKLVIVSACNDDATIEICRNIRAGGLPVMIVMMGHGCDSMTIAKGFRVGIDGYVSKETSCASLVEMMKLVALGEKLIPSQVVFDLAGLEIRSKWNDTDGIIEDANISAREVEILQGLIRGDPNKIISRGLNITEATVKVHVKSILRKLHVVNRTQAAIWAVTRGLMPVDIRSTNEAVKSQVISNGERQRTRFMMPATIAMGLSASPTTSHFS
jgi:two-component system nitrate/nitrite response regulator NarL